MMKRVIKPAAACWLVVGSLVGCSQPAKKPPAPEGKGIGGTIKGFHHISLSVKDVDKSIAFYRNLFGCELLPGGGMRSGKEVSEGVGVPNAELKNFKLRAPNSDVIIELIEYVSVKGKPLAPHHISDFHIAHTCFIVDDLDRTYELLKAKEVRFLSPPVVVAQTGAKFNYAYDPDGNMIELVQLPKK
ncbi:MAG: VOC family protein [Planctomycetota bacterium]|jgi:catechol 2,3-dioxygenase-like lactoylglutathione lyase family enzyme